jgi:hypothetical protein
MPIETYSYSLTVLPFTLAVCRMPPNNPLPVWAAETRLLSLTRTEDELSLVCEEALVPAGVQREPGWRALKVTGPLDFSLTGVLSSLLAPLAQAGVSIFAISTYDTDYLLVKEANLNEAVAALRGAGHQVSAG